MEQGVRQLNLGSSWLGPVVLADRVGVVPGLRSSAAFFTFLRANLVLTPSAVSAMANNTPALEPSSPRSPYPPPPPSSSALSPPQRLACSHDIPRLTIKALSADAEKAEGLRLVADSVAQMQRRAARVLASHPLCLASLAAIAPIMCRLASLLGRRTALALALAVPVAVALLLALRLYTRGYAALAADINLSWLEPVYGVGQEVVLGACYGDTLVGALVLRLEPSRVPASPPRRKGRSRCASLKGGKGVIRAWTTDAKYRRQGVGRHLLLAAVKMTKKRCGKDAQVGFARQHANSVMLLPSIFAASFRKDENRAAKALDDAASEWEMSRKKR